MPAASSASSSASAVAALAAWWRPRRPTRVRPRRGSSTTIPSRSQPSSGAGRTSVKGTPRRRARRRTTASPSPSAPVTARSPRSMIAAFSRAILAIVSPSRSMWSRSTLVTTATPPSQACVASSRPPSPTSTSATSGRTSANRREDDRGQQLELGRLAVAARDPVGRAEHTTDQPREVVGGDRPPVDADPLAIGHEVRLGRRTDAIAGRPERRVGQGEHAALAVGAGHQRAADRQLGMAELAQQRTRPAKPEPDTETAARGDRSQGLVVGEVGPRRGHRSPVTRGTARPRRRRTG